MSTTTDELLDRETFTTRLRNVGDGRFRETHPLVADIEAGRAAPAAVKRWITARYYHQAMMPRHDALILANCPLREVRRSWLDRIMDYDGRRGDQGAIGGWIQLGEAAGLARRDLEENQHLLPEVRSTVDEQVELVEKTAWPAAVASTLVDLVAPDLLREPIQAFEKHYTWIDPAGLAYFRSRPTQAARTNAYALDCAARYCDTPDLQRQAVQALERKCELLWLMLDAVAAG